MPVVGILVQTGPAKFKWEIPHFSNLRSKKRGTSAISPQIQISNSAWWWLRIYPKGTAPAYGRIHLRLYRLDDNITKNTRCTLWLKRADGEKEEPISVIGKVIREYYTKVHYEFPKRLEECKEGELLASDTLNVICRLVYEEEAGPQDGTLLLRQKFWERVLSRMEQNASNVKENEDRLDCAPTRKKDITLTSTKQTQCSDAMTDQENEDVYYDCISPEVKEIAAVDAERQPAFQKLKTDLGRILSGQRFCDVVLVSSDGRKFPAHRFILEARSSVFSKMFESGVEGTRISEIILDGIEGAILKKLLNYLYTASLDGIDFSDMPKLFLAADKYGVSSLKEKCTQGFLDTTSLENIVDSITIGDNLEAEQLEGLSKASISKVTFKARETSV